MLSGRRLDISTLALRYYRIEDIAHGARLRGALEWPDAGRGTYSVAAFAAGREIYRLTVRDPSRAGGSRTCTTPRNVMIGDMISPVKAPWGRTMPPSTRGLRLPRVHCASACPRRCARTVKAARSKRTTGSRHGSRRCSSRTSPRRRPTASIRRRAAPDSGDRTLVYAITEVKAAFPRPLYYRAARECDQTGGFWAVERRTANRRRRLGGRVHVGQLTRTRALLVIGGFSRLLRMASATRHRRSLAAGKAEQSAAHETAGAARRRTIACALFQGIEQLLAGKSALNAVNNKPILLQPPDWLSRLLTQNETTKQSGETVAWSAARQQMELKTDQDGERGGVSRPMVEDVGRLVRPAA